MEVQVHECMLMEMGCLECDCSFLMASEARKTCLRHIESES